MKRTEPPPEPPSIAWRRYVLVGAGLLLLVGLFVVFFWPRIQIGLWINALNSNDAELLRETRRKLEESPRPGVNEALRDALHDDDRTFQVRTMVGRVLVERNRVNLVEDALRTGTLSTRTAALSVMADQPNYRGELLPDPSARVKETLLDWIRGRLDGLDRAVQLASDGRVAEAMPEIRSLLDRSALDRFPPSVQMMTLIASMRAVIELRDCESVPKVLALARDPDVIVRENALKAARDAVAKDGSPCPGAVTDEQVRLAIEGALSDPESSVRNAALLLLIGSSWIAPVRERVWALLDSDASETERRLAVMALGSSRDPLLAERLPRLVHDRHPQVRAQAAGAVLVLEERTVAVPRLRGLHVGILAYETRSREAYDIAVGELIEISKDDWIGFPESVHHAAIRAAEQKDETFQRRVLAEMFERGEAEGVSRASWARAWFVRFAQSLGLDGESAERAAAARDAFWTAHLKGDEAGARAALEPFDSAPPGLFLYERGALR